MSKSVVFLTVFARSKRGNVEKCRVFVCFLGKVEKWSVFVCFGFCVFLLGRRREMSKSVVFVKKSVVFLCVSG